MAIPQIGFCPEHGFELLPPWLYRKTYRYSGEERDERGASASHRGIQWVTLEASGTLFGLSCSDMKNARVQRPAWLKRLKHPRDDCPRRVQWVAMLIGRFLMATCGRRTIQHHLIAATAQPSHAQTIAQCPRIAVPLHSSRVDSLLPAHGRCRLQPSRRCECLFAVIFLPSLGDAGSSALLPTGTDFSPVPDLHQGRHREGHRR